MATSATVVIPWVEGCEHRERALDWLRGSYAAQRPHLQVRVATGSLPWSKGAAINPVVRELPPGSIVVMSDADVWCEGLDDAVDAVAAGADWAIPHCFVRRLSEDATAAVLRGAEFDHRLDLVRPRYLGLIGGGLVVARRELLLEVPLDPRFVGWGQEDESWGVALTCIAGQPWRGEPPLWHFWHPPQERLSARRGSLESMALRKRYLQARRNPAGMRRLLQEVIAG
jgi:hypothetical protein